MFGKYLDLTTPHQVFLNLAPEAKTYRDYLSVCDDFSLIPNKESASYYSYLVQLKTYLESFIHKATPLFDFLALKSNLVRQFNLDWLDGKYQSNVTSDLWCVSCMKEFATKGIKEIYY